MYVDSFLQVGHLSKDCPRDKAGADDYEEYYEDYGAHPKKESGDGGGGGVASIVCHHCQQTGHTRRNCPQADEKKVKPGDYSNVTCFHCKVSSISDISSTPKIREIDNEILLFSYR